MCAWNAGIVPGDAAIDSTCMSPLSKSALLGIAQESEGYHMFGLFPPNSPGIPQSPRTPFPNLHFDFSGFASEKNGSSASSFLSDAPQASPECLASLFVQPSADQNEVRLRPVMISHHDVDGRFSYASPEFETMLSLNCTELLSRSLFELVHPDDLVKLSKVRHFGLCTPMKVRFRIRVGGSYVKMESLFRPLFDGEGANRVFYGFHSVAWIVDGTEFLETTSTLPSQAEEDVAGLVYSKTPKVSILRTTKTGASVRKRERKCRPSPDGGLCIHCAAQQSPEWRRGPDGRKNLCNACGLRFAKQIKRFRIGEGQDLDNAFFVDDIQVEH